MRCQICAVNLYAARTRLPNDPVSHDPHGWLHSREEKARKRKLTSCSVLKDQSGCQERDLMHPNGHTILSEHAPGPGCNCDRAYSGSRISHLEMQGSDDTTFVVQKSHLECGRFSYEQESNFYIPSNPCCIADQYNVWAFKTPENPEEMDIEGNYFFPCNSYSGHESLFLGPPQFVGFPVHTWCWKIFERVSAERSLKVDLQGFATLFFHEACRNCGFVDMLHHPAIAKNQRQDPSDSNVWAYAAGTEFLVANPQEIPGFLFSLQQSFSVTLEEQAKSLHAVDQVPQNKSDFFIALPYEIRTQIAQQLYLAENLTLRFVSRVFSAPNSNLYLHLIKRDFPWFHEFDQVKDLNDLYHSKLEAVRQADLVSLESYIQNVKRADIGERMQRQLDAGLSLKPPLRLPDWEQLYKNLYSARRSMKGVQNREMIWGLVEEIVDRIADLRGRVEEEWDEKSGMMLLPGRPKEPIIDWETWKKTGGCCMRCRKLD